MTLLVAADPELHQHYSAGAYALGIVEFLAIALLLIGLLCVIWHRFAMRRLTSHLHNAIDRGDEQILRAIEESEDAYARRPQQHASVPRQLERNHR